MPLSSDQVFAGKWYLLSLPQGSKVLTMCLTTPQLRPTSPWSQRWTQVGNLGAGRENIHQFATSVRGGPNCFFLMIFLIQTT